MNFIILIQHPSGVLQVLGAKAFNLSLLKISFICFIKDTDKVYIPDIIIALNLNKLDKDNR